MSTILDKVLNTKKNLRKTELEDIANRDGAYNGYRDLNDEVILKDAESSFHKALDVYNKEYFSSNTTEEQKNLMNNDYKNASNNFNKLGAIQKAFTTEIIEGNIQDIDPRIATKKEIEEAGFTLKEGSIGVIAEIKNTRGETTWKETYYNGTQVVLNDKFLPYENKFSIPPTEQELEIIGKLEKMAEMQGIKILHFGTVNFVSTKHDFLVLPPKDSFKTPKEYILKFAHEIMHTKQPIIEWADVDIEKLSPKQSEQYQKQYAINEINAELGALHLVQELGMNIDEDMIQRSAKYIKGYEIQAKNDFNYKEIIESIKESADSLIKSLDDRQISPNQSINETQETYKIYQKLSKNLTEKLIENGAEKWIRPILSDITHACVERGIRADKIAHMGIDVEKNIIYVVADNKRDFATVDAIEAAKVNPEERLLEANQLQNELSQHIEQKELDRQLQLAQQQERGGHSFG